MVDHSSIELSRAAFRNNLSFIRQLLGPEVRFSSVVKGNAYGHGIREFVSLAYSCGVRHFSVFSADEALEIRRVLGNRVQVLVMGLVEGEALEWAIANDVEFFVFDRQRLRDALAMAKKTGKSALIHLELETGMNRTGVSPRHLSDVVDLLKENSNVLAFKGLCTHYAGAESIGNYGRVRAQIDEFAALEQQIRDAGLQPEARHTACSAASVMFPETRMEMVRIGILQYGMWPSPETLIHYLNSKKIRKDPLRRVITWKSKVMSTKHVETGEFIGYGTSYMAREQMRIAVVPVGYAHGYSRSLSNQGRVLVGGHRCAVVGTVNMNMMAVDVSEVEDIRKGDEVTLIGNQDDLSVSVASFSEYSNQLNYELLTRLPRNIPRHVVD